MLAQSEWQEQPRAGCAQARVVRGPGEKGGCVGRWMDGQADSIGVTLQTAPTWVKTRVDADWAGQWPGSDSRAEMWKLQTTALAWLAGSWGPRLEPLPAKLLPSLA